MARDPGRAIGAATDMLMAVQFIIEVNGSPPARVSLADGEHVVGSRRDAAVRIRCPTVSRRHARLVVEGGKVTVENLGSTNGTTVGGRRISGTTPVPAGETIGLGSARLQPLHPDRRPRASSSPLPRPDEEASGALLGAHTMSILRSAGDEHHYQAGDVIVRRGDRGGSFYAVVDGEVDLCLGDGEGPGRPVARLGPGTTFGAEAVAGRSAAIDAVAATAVTVLVHPADRLPDLPTGSTSLQRKLLGGMARRLQDITADAVELLRGTGVVARLAQGDEEAGVWIAVSSKMRSVASRLDRCSGRRGPVLIVGDGGTGKLTAARRIHHASGRAAAPLIVVACERLDPVRSAELILGDRPVSGTDQKGDRTGGVHLAHGGTLVLRNADTLDHAAQELLASFLEAGQQRAGGFPDPRVVLLARFTSPPEAGARGLVPQLADRVADVVHLPPLAERPKDILPMAESFLRNASAAPVRFSEEARASLLSLEYRRHNVAELRDIVDLAARCTDGDEIRPEHLFEGIGSEVRRGAVDLTRTGPVSWLTRGLPLAALRGATLLGFLAVITVAVVAPSSAVANAANDLVWGVWEPAVFCLFLVIGAVWCTICPLSTAARLCQRLGSLRRPPPRWARRWGPWLTAAGFLTIVWAERALDMFERPRPTGWLLGALILAAVTGALVYRRELWCRHLCPLGRLAVVLAPAAPLRLSARGTVCAFYCTEHACFRGARGIPGCTVFHHPLEARQAHHCKLCLDCLRTCPHGSARLEACAPLARVWSVDSSASHLGPFATVLAALAIGLLAAAHVTRLQGMVPVTMTCLAAAAAGALSWLALQRLSDDRAAGTALPIRAALAFAVVGWGALMAVELEHVPLIHQARVVVVAPAVDLGVVVIAQLSVLGLSLLMTLLALSRSSGRDRRDPRSRCALWALQALAILYAACAVALVLR